jgi:hypothetical protein
MKGLLILFSIVFFMISCSEPETPQNTNNLNARQLIVIDSIIITGDVNRTYIFGSNGGAQFNRLSCAGDLTFDYSVSHLINSFGLEPDILVKDYADSDIGPGIFRLDHGDGGQLSAIQLSVSGNTESGSVVYDPDNQYYSCLGKIFNFNQEGDLSMFQGTDFVYQTDKKTGFTEVGDSYQLFNFFIADFHLFCSARPIKSYDGYDFENTYIDNFLVESNITGTKNMHVRYTYKYGVMIDTPSFPF